MISNFYTKSNNCDLAQFKDLLTYLPVHLYYCWLFYFCLSQIKCCPARVCFVWSFMCIFRPSPLSITINHTGRDLLTLKQFRFGPWFQWTFFIARRYLSFYLTMQFAVSVPAQNQRLIPGKRTSITLPTEWNVVSNSCENTNCKRAFVKIF